MTQTARLFTAHDHYYHREMLPPTPINDCQCIKVSRDPNSVVIFLCDGDVVNKMQLLDDLLCRLCPV